MTAEKGNNESELCRRETGLASNPPCGTGLVKQRRSLILKSGIKIHGGSPLNSPSSLFFHFSLVLFIPILIVVEVLSHIAISSMTGV